MKVNLYSTDDPNKLVLKVSDAPDITDVLFNFLTYVAEVDETTLQVLEENTVEFTVEEDIPEERYKDWKLSIINTVREMLTQNESALKEHYLISHQQLEVIEREFNMAQAQLLQTRLELTVQDKLNQRLMAVVGLAMIVTFIAIIVAVVGIFV